MSEAIPFGSQPAAIRSSGGDVRASIARASAATGIDFDYLLAQAKIESSLDPSARARTSSAAGLYQFTRGTWLATLERHGDEHGLGWAGAAIEGGRVADPVMRAHIMALRHDPDAAALMAAELASDNRAVLAGQLGREPDAAELYLAHFLGAGGASQFLAALQSDPGRSAASLMPEAAGANRGIFFAAGGAPRSVGEVMNLLRTKVFSAMEGAGSPGPAAYAGLADYPGVGAAPASVPAEFRAAQAEVAQAGGARLASAGLSAPAPAPRASMADTLRDAFGLAQGGSAGAPGFVRAAYGTLRSMGL